MPAHPIIQTRWCVITGAPSSGKTTVIEALGHLGFETKPETSRTYVEAELRKGRTLQDIRGDPAAFQRTLVRLKVANESNMPPDQIIFLDRALGDSVTYYQFVGLDPQAVIDLFSGRRYWKVFIFDRFPLMPDHVRIEDESQAAFLDREFERNYRSLGYMPIRIPVLPVQARVDLILKHLDGILAPAQHNSRA